MMVENIIKHNTTQHNTTQHNTTQHVIFLSFLNKVSDSCIKVAL